jgi:hypothetical protein
LPNAGTADHKFEEVEVLRRGSRSKTSKQSAKRARASHDGIPDPFRRVRWNSRGCPRASHALAGVNPRDRRLTAGLSIVPTNPEQRPSEKEIVYVPVSEIDNVLTYCEEIHPER